MEYENCQFEQPEEVETKEIETANDEPKTTPFFTFAVYPGNHPEAIREGLLRRGNFTEAALGDETTIIDEVHVIWRPVQYPKKILQYLEKVSLSNCERRKPLFNHIEALKGITAKTTLIRSLKHYYDFLPEAIAANFIIQAGVEDEEYFGLMQRYKDISQGIFFKEHLPSKHCRHNFWLVKPANMNQGRGIEICKNLREIGGCISSKPTGSLWVVQKYIERPLLYHGRKFDLRLWVLVNSKCDAYLYKEGYMRTSSDDFTLDRSENYVHLTNNCLQQHGDNYGLHEDGNTLSLQVLEDYFKEKFPEENISYREHVIPRIKDLVLDTLLAVRKNIRKQAIESYELLGYDFMIDEDLRVWLIEVNTNPYLGVPNKFIAELLPRMVDEMLDLVLLPDYPAVKPRTETVNNYELIYQEKGGQINQRRDFSKKLLYPILTFEQKESTNRLPKDCIKLNQSVKKSQDPIQSIKEFNREKSNIQKKKIRELRKKNEVRTSSVCRIPHLRNGAQVMKESTFDYGEITMVESKQENIGKRISQILRHILAHLNYLASQRELTEKIIQDQSEFSKGLKNLYSKTKYFRVLFADERSLLELLTFASDYSNSLQSPLREEVLNIFLSASREYDLKRHFLNTEFLHRLFESLLEAYIQKHDSLRIYSQIMMNLLSVLNPRAYLPGEKLDDERMRVKLIQHGYLIVMMHVAEEGEFGDMINGFITKQCTKEEIRWTLRMLPQPIEKGLPSLEIKTATIEPSEVSKLEEITDEEEIRLSRLLAMWTGKELILSEKISQKMDFEKIKNKLNEKLILKRVKVTLSKKRYSKKFSQKKINEEREEQTKGAEELRSLFKRFEHKKQFELIISKREIGEKERIIRENESRQKEYLHYIRRVEIERKANEMKRIKELALAYQKGGKAKQASNYQSMTIDNPPEHPRTPSPIETASRKNKKHFTARKERVSVGIVPLNDHISTLFSVYFAGAHPHSRLPK